MPPLCHIIGPGIYRGRNRCSRLFLCIYRKLFCEGAEASFGLSGLFFLETLVLSVVTIIFTKINCVYMYC